MTKSNNIILIGPMGAGKTTIGRQLAKKSSKYFYDSDHEIERSTGADIPLIFEIEKEEGFRLRESKIIAGLLKQDNIVLSTGGGAVLSEANRKLLNESGFVIYLKTTAEKLYRRTAGDKRRPLLQGDDRMNQIKKILEEREPLYTSLADRVIDTEKSSIKQIIEKILSIKECQ